VTLKAPLALNLSKGFNISYGYIIISI